MNSLYTMPLMMGIAYITRTIEWTDEYILYARIFYYSIQFLVLLSLLYVRMTIISKNETKMIDISDKNKDKKAPPQLIPIQEYDLQQWNELIKSFSMTLVLLSFIHFKFGVIVPLVSQPIVGTIQTMSNNLLKIHLFKGDVRRPFPKPESPFGNFMKQD